MDLVGRPASPPKNLVARPKIFEREAKRQNGNNKSMPNGIRVIWNFVRQPKKKTICKWIAGEKREEGPSARLMVHARRRSRVVFFFWGISWFHRVYLIASLSLSSIVSKWLDVDRAFTSWLFWLGWLCCRPAIPVSFYYLSNRINFKWSRGQSSLFFPLTIKMRTETTVQVQRNGNSH